MTTASSTVTAGPYLGSGTGPYSFGFRVAADGVITTAEQIEVVQVLVSTGAETPLVLTTDFTVAVNADQDSAPGGSITLTTSLSGSYDLYIRLNPPFTQTTDLSNQAPYNAQVVENRFDAIERQLITLLDRVRRAPRLGIQALASFSGEVSGTPSVGQIPTINSALTGFEWVANNGSSSLVTAIGSTTARTLADREADRTNVLDQGVVGDGVTDDAARFQAALNIGKPVYIPGGKTVYIGGTVTITIPAGVRIFGDGDLSVIKGSAATRVNTQDFLSTGGHSNISIRDLKIDGDRTHASDQINGISIDNNSTNVVIDNVTFVDHGVAVWIEESIGTQISNCRFNKVASNKSGIAVQPTSTNVAKNILIWGCSFGASDQEAIDINGGCQYLSIAACTFYSSQLIDDVGDFGEAIDIGSPNFDITDVSVTGCVFDMNGATSHARGCITIKQKTHRVSVTGNVFYNTQSGSPSDAVTVANSFDVSVTGNVFQKVKRALGIADAASLTTNSERIDFVGNTCYDIFTDAVVINGTTVLDVVIANNTIDGNASGETNNHGLNLTNCDGLTITGNSIKGFDADAINVASSCVDVTITANKCSDCGSDGISNSAAGAVISANVCTSNTAMGIRQNSATTKISNNDCRLNGTNGISLASGADSNIISGNTLISNTTAGLSLGASLTDVVITDNIANSNGADYSGMTNADGNSVVRGNIGYRTENSGTASISPDANGNGTIAHGLIITPTAVTVSMGGDMANAVDVQTVGSTNITVRIKNPATNADVTAGAFTVYWEAKAKP